MSSTLVTRRRYEWMGSSESYGVEADDLVRLAKSGWRGELRVHSNRASSGPEIRASRGKVNVMSMSEPAIPTATAA